MEDLLCDEEFMKALKLFGDFCDQISFILLLFCAVFCGNDLAEGVVIMSHDA